MLMAGLVGVAAWRAGAPPRPEGAVARDSFSADRAFALLERALGQQAPHPVGTASNAQVRARLLALLEEAGYTAEVHSGFACGRGGSCAPVHNVAARLPGAGRLPGAILLTAHYDSVPAGPGASDDGINVAALIEVARILREGPPLERDVIFLLTDGEEAGLLGARAFVASDPWAADVGVVLNFEGRGSSGAALMFETHSGNAGLIDLLARAVPSAVASSAFTAVYERLPNDTDFTIYKRAGYAGLNFAHAGHLEHYHTPLDDLDHVSLDTLHHHGASALSLARALARVERLPTGGAGAVFFDVFRSGLVRWPDGLALPLALAGLVGLLMGAHSAVRRGLVGARGLAWGGAVLPGLLTVAAAGAWLFVRALEAATGWASPWTAHPAPARVAVWALTAAALLGVGSFLVRRSGGWGAWLGFWNTLALAGVVLASILPASSYAMVFPALVAAGALHASGALRVPGSAARRAVAWLLPQLALATVWLPSALSMETIFGLRLAAPLIAALLVCCWASFVPLLDGLPRPSLSRLAAVALGVAGLAAALAAWMPVVSAEHPVHASILYVEDPETRQARWRIETSGPPPPPPLSAAAQIESHVTALLPVAGRPGPVHLGEAPSHSSAGPEVETVRSQPWGDGRKLDLWVRSGRGARSVALFVPPEADLRWAEVEGQRLPEPRAPRGAGRWRRIAHEVAPPGGFEASLVLGNHAPVDIFVVDQVFELPSSARALGEARPATAVPVHAGDRWLVMTRARL